MALIRPATVLSFLLFIALGCLLVSILSAPIVKQIALATNNDVKFGVFGYCTGANNAEICTGITLGYNVDSLSAPQDFTLPSKARITLTNLLIIHPIGALLVLILLVLTIVSHFYGPGHSPGYLLFLVFFSIFTCVVAILAFLVDILLFVPHLAVGGYIVVGAPICLAIVVVGLCATRRRVVGKQDRKRRIAETANTNNQSGNSDINSNGGFATEHGSTADAGTFRVDSPGGKLPEFATFEVGKPGSDGPGLDETGERIPLNPRHQSPTPGMSLHRISTDNIQGDFGQTTGGPPNFAMGSRPSQRGANQYNPGSLPANHRLPLNNPNSPGPGAFGQPGASHYGPPRYGPGPNGPRGPPGGQYRGGPTPQPGYGGPRGSPHNDYAVGDQARGPPNAGFPGPYNAPPISGFNDGHQHGANVPIIPRGISPGMQGLGPKRGPSPHQQANGYYQDSSIQPPDVRQQALIGGMGSEPLWPSQHYGRPSQQRQQPDAGDDPSDDDSRIDTESRGQPSRQDFITTALAPGPGSGGRVGETEALVSPDGLADKERIASTLSEDGNTYVPPRTQWQAGNDQSKDTPVPSIEQLDNAVMVRPSPSPMLRNPTPQQPIAPRSEEQSAIELPADVSPSAASKPSKQSTDNYYEDVDPRFAESSQDLNPVPYNNVTADEGVPAMLIPGYNPRIGASRPPQSGPPAQFQRPNYGYPQNNSNQANGFPPRPPNGQQYVPYALERPTYPEYDAPPPQSPAFSEQTNFTSISQRPINPRWQPPPGQLPPARAPPRNMPLLSGNPDFELPTLSQGRGGPRGRAPGAIPPGLGSDRGGRYPLPPPNMPR